MVNEGRTLLQLYHAAFRARNGPTGLEQSKVLSKHSWSGLLTVVWCLPRWQNGAISTGHVAKGRFDPRRVVGSCQREGGL